MDVGSPILSLPQGIYVDSMGTLFVADSGSHTIKKVNSTISGLLEMTFSLVFIFAPHALNCFCCCTRGDVVAGGGTVVVLAGGGSDYIDGTATNAKFNTPSGVVGDLNGNLFIADTNNRRIRMISSSGGSSKLL